MKKTGNRMLSWLLCAAMLLSFTGAFGPALVAKAASGDDPTEEGRWIRAFDFQDGQPVFVNASSAGTNFAGTTSVTQWAPNAAGSSTTYMGKHSLNWYLNASGDGNTSIGLPTGSPSAVIPNSQNLRKIGFWMRSDDNLNAPYGLRYGLVIGGTYQMFTAAGNFSSANKQWVWVELDPWTDALNGGSASNRPDGTKTVALPTAAAGTSNYFLNWRITSARMYSVQIANITYIYDTAVTSAMINSDTAPPAVDITADGNPIPAFLGGDDPIVVTVTDSQSGVDIDRLSIRLNGDEIIGESFVTPGTVANGYTYSIDLTDIEANNTLSAEAWDKFGFCTIEVLEFFLGEPPPPSITTTQLAEARYLIPFEDRVYAEAAGAAVVWSIVNGALPDGLTLESDTGVISGTPAEHGAFSFTLKAENAFGFDERLFTLIVQPPAPPAFAAPTPSEGALSSGAPDNYYYVFLGVESDYDVTWSISSGALPPGLELIQSPSLIAGLPTEAGNFTFTLRVENYGGHADRTFTVHIDTESGSSSGKQPLLTMDKLFFQPATAASLTAAQANVNIGGCSATGIPLFMRRGVGSANNEVWGDWQLVETTPGNTSRRTAEGFFQLYTPVETGRNVFQFFQPGLPMIQSVVTRAAAASSMVLDEPEIKEQNSSVDNSVDIIVENMLSDGTVRQDDTMGIVSWDFAGVVPRELSASASINTDGLVDLDENGQRLTLYLGTQSKAPSMRDAEIPEDSIFQSMSWGTTLEGIGYLNLDIKPQYILEGYDVRVTDDGRFELLAQTRRNLSEDSGAPFAGFKFVIDIGHGNNDAGALGPMGSQRSVEGFRWTENDINYANGNLMAQKLRDLGAEVLITGTLYDPSAGAAYPLAQRVADANDFEADAFLAFHCNSMDNSVNLVNVRGFTVWVHSSAAPGAVATPLARAFLDKLYNITPDTTRLNNVNSSAFAVCNQTARPAMIFEAAFVTSVTDFAWMIDPAEREHYTNTMVDVLLGYYSLEPIAPVITINTQPAASTKVTQGGITGSLAVSAKVTQSATLSYQWYSNTTNSSAGGTEVSGATDASFAIPDGLTAGTYYYFCEVRATDGATPVRSNVAAVNVVKAAPQITIGVSVSTPTIVATLGAYLNITADGAPEGAKAYLVVDGAEKHETAIENDKGRMYIPAAPEAGTYKLVVEGENAEGSCDIEVVEYNTNIWIATAFADGDGWLSIKFNAPISSKTNFVKSVAIGGRLYDATVVNGDTLVVPVKYNDLADADKVIVSGVKYAELFPSYSFTFTIALR